MTDDEVKEWRKLSTTNELYKQASLNFQTACEALNAKLRVLQEKYDKSVSDKAVAENGQQTLQRALNYISAEIVAPLDQENEQLRRGQAAHADALAQMSRRNYDLVAKVGDVERQLKESVQREAGLVAQIKQLCDGNDNLNRELDRLDCARSTERKEAALEISKLRATLACREGALKAAEERAELNAWCDWRVVKPELAKAVATTQMSQRFAQEEPKPTHEPAPAKTANEPVKPYVMAALNLRMADGALKYGTPLCLFNGRDGVNDAAEEVMDAVQYLVQSQEEQKLLASREGYFENGVRVRLHNSRLMFSVSSERLYYRRFISATEQTVRDLILKAGGYNIEDLHSYFLVSVGPEVNIAKFVRTVLDALRVDTNANAKTV